MNQARGYYTVTDEWLPLVEENSERAYGAHFYFELTKEGNLIATDMSGAIITSDQFLRISELMQKTFGLLSDERIAAYNIATEARAEEAEKRRREETKAWSRLKSMSRKAGTVYLLKSGDLHKIGMTKNLEARLLSLSAASANPVSVIHFITTDDMFALERDLHARFADKREQGEWFALTPEDVEFIKSL